MNIHKDTSYNKIFTELWVQVFFEHILYDKYEIGKWMNAYMCINTMFSYLDMYQSGV